MVALLLVLVPLVVVGDGHEESVEGPVCSQRVLHLRESRANNNLTISVRTSQPSLTISPHPRKNIERDCAS